MADDFGLYVTDMLRKNAKDYRVKRPPTTKAGKALHAVAAFFGAIARTVLRRKNAEAVRNFDVGSVLETFLREGEMFRNSTMANAEAARDARNRSTVVDEDGTVVAYHERGGRDVTAEDFERTFGIRLAMDGDARSQDTANVCYDTLLKLAKLMGVPQETLGIGGLLTLDIAVVEELLNPVFHPTNNTINLTIPNNVNVPEIATAATIVHEWTHALDRIVGLGRDADPNVEITEETTGALSHGIGPQVREELLQAGKRMTEALRNTRFYERISNDEEIKELDREDPEAQLFDPQEVFARALANYYLANELGRIPMFDEGLGPTMDELAEVGPILREFFDALEVGVNETTGVQTLYHDPEGRTRYEWENWTREEKLERIRATNDIHIVTPIEGDEAELLAKYLEKAEGHKKDIVDWALNEQNRIVSAINTNAFIGNIKTSGNSIRSILSHGSGPLKVLVLRHLDEILTNAVPYRIGKGKKEGRTFINLAHRLSFDGREHIAYVSILEDRNGNRTYDVEFGSEERLLRELPNGPAARNESEADADSRNTNSIAQSGEDVKSDPNEERRDHIKVWSGAPQEFAVPSLAFVGSGTGGNNEGRGLYSSGVRGVAQDKYARGAIEDDEFITAWNKVVLDGVSMKQADAAKMIARKLSDGQALTLDEHVFHYYIWPKINPKRLGASEFTTREWLADDIRADFRRLDIIRKMTSLPTKRVNDKHAPGGVVEVYEPSEFGPSLPVEVVNKDIKKFEQKTHGLDPEKIKEQIERIFPDVLPAVMEQTWFTNRPEGDVSHLLNWFEAVTPEQMGWILDGARKAGFSEEEIAFLQRERIDDNDVLIEDGNRMPSGREMYMRLELIALRRQDVSYLYDKPQIAEMMSRYDNVTASDLWEAHGEVMGDIGKFASEFLVSADIDGMMYPVDYRHGNRDGRVSGWNYVAFSDKYLRVDHVYEYNPETDDFEKKWHEGGGSVPRFTETPLGQELVAKAFDVLVGVDADLLLRPWHYGEKRDPGKGLVTAGLGRELDMTEEKGFAAEVSARISRFGTREGDPTLREIRARCGSKERFYEVLGAVFETAVGLKEGVYDVITPREFKTMEKRMPLYAWVIRHNAQARATALGRKAYIMGREFAERLHREALAAARAEVERQRGKASEARAQTREAKAQTRNAERREETARIKLKKAEFSAAEADFIARWRLAEERAISRMRRRRNKREWIKGRKGSVKGSWRDPIVVRGQPL